MSGDVGKAMEGIVDNLVAHHRDRAIGALNRIIARSATIATINRVLLGLYVIRKLEISLDRDAAGGATAVSRVAAAPAEAAAAAGAIDARGGASGDGDDARGGVAALEAGDANVTADDANATAADAANATGGAAASAAGALAQRLLTTVCCSRPPAVSRG